MLRVVGGRGLEVLGIVGLIKGFRVLGFSEALFERV